jgi:hypothetical protein
MPIACKVDQSGLNFQQNPNRVIARLPLKENPMNSKIDIAHRLAMLEGVEFSSDDLDAIAAEVEDLQSVLAEIEEFAQTTPWISQQIQPAGKKVGP